MDKKLPRVSVQVLVVKDDQIMIGYHIDKDIYGLPGGHWENQESIEEAALREVEEESGVKCKDLQFVKNLEHYNESKGTNYLVVSYVAQYDSGDFHDEPEKTTDWKWMHIDEAMKLPLYSTGKILIEEYQNLLFN